MANVKLSQIASGGAFVAATDTPVAVRNGTTDVLVTLGTAAEHAASDFPLANGTGATGTWGISVTGNAGTATALQNARTIGAVSFDGTANIVPQTIQMADESADTTCFPLIGNASGSVSQQPKTNASLGFNASSGALSATSFSGSGASLTGVAILGSANTFTSGIQYLNGATLEEAVFSNGNSGTSKTIALDNGNFQSVTITGAVTLGLTAPTHPCKITLVVTQDGSGHVYSVGGGIKWPGGAAPTYSTAASNIDVISIIYDGTNFYGMGGIAFA